MTEKCYAATINNALMMRYDVLNKPLSVNLTEFKLLTF